MLAIALVGCSSPRNANKENFKALIDSFYEKKDIKCIDAPFVFIQKFPVTVSKIPKDNYRKIEISKLNALVGVGLLDITSSDDKLITYSLTPKGSKYRMLSDNEWLGFCAAEFQVDKLINFTEPSVLEGRTVSKVYFSISIKSIADWARDEKITKAFSAGFYLEDSLKKNPNKEHSALLVLMNDGWVLESGADAFGNQKSHKRAVPL